MKNRFGYYVLILCCAVVGRWENIEAQPIHQYSINEGLSQSTVYAIHQCAAGLIWLGTREGLDVFDGYTFQPISLPDVTGASVNVPVREIVEANGTIWVATDGQGLFAVNPITYEARSVEYSEPEYIDRFLISMAASEDGKNIYTGSRNGHLYQVSADKNTINLFETNISENYNQISTVWALTVDRNDEIWVGTDEGIKRLDKEGNLLFERYGYRTLALTSDKQNRLWIGTEQNGVMVLDPNEDYTRSVVIPAAAGNSIYDITIDADGNVWMGTDQNVVFTLSKENNSAKIPEFVQSSQHFQDEIVRSVLVDSSGMVWMGTNSSGLLNYSAYRERFGFYESPEYCGNVIFSLTEPKEHELWLGTERSGICIYNTKSREFQTADDNSYSNILTLISGYSIPAMITTDNGNVWIGSDTGGLFIYNPEQQEIVTHLTSENAALSDDTILTLLEHTDGTVWVGTYRGVQRISPKTFEIQSVELNDQKVSDSRILMLYEDTRQRVWTGAFSGGPKLFEPDGTPIPVSDNKEFENILHERVYNVTSLPEGGYLIATSNGLYKSDEHASIEKSFSNTMVSGQTIYAILQDNKGRYWMSTNSGLVVYNEQENEFLRYGKKAGLRTTEFNGGAYFRLHSGNFAFGTVDGFTLFDADNIRSNTSHTPIVLRAINVNGEPYLLSDEEKKSGTLRLAHHQNFLELEVAALDYVYPAANKYRYRVANQRSNWSSLGINRVLSLISMQPGTYQLEIAGSNSDEIWSENPYQLSVVITAPFWLQPWFILLAAFILMATGYQIYRYRMYYVLKEEKMRMRIARDLHDDISGTLSSISFLADAISQKMLPEEGRNRFLDMITESSRQAKDRISDIIWAIDPELDSWDELTLRCKHLASEVLESRDITLDFDVEYNTDTKPGVGIRKNLWLIFKEVITNIVRHADCTKVQIRFKQSAHKLNMTIVDNGSGFNPEIITEGYGIKNIKMRAKNMNGHAEVRTTPGKGTTWEINIEKR